MQGKFYSLKSLVLVLGAHSIIMENVKYIKVIVFGLSTKNVLRCALFENIGRNKIAGSAFVFSIWLCSIT